MCMLIRRMISTYMCNMPNQVSTKLSRKETQEITKLVKSGLFINTSDFVRDAIRRRLQELGNVSMDTPEVIQQRVYEYFKHKGGSAWPDEAAIDLGYSVLEVLEALERLERKGKAREAAYEVSIMKGGRS